ncbi:MULTISPECIES: zf-HC2 domain-containing protein [Rodentibacter]|uniref:zf-HC2 domain-containing protein n=1 Tax=Rodentibacter TaxID=1960084 RepID=UPI001CFE3D02|nr:zf-HC2 domain-containing protein [Rodentibacter sp. JRC1]
MNCLQTTQKLSESQERRLTLKEQIGVKSHLLICPHCRNFQRNCASLSHLIKQFRAK